MSSVLWVLSSQRQPELPRNCMYTNVGTPTASQLQTASLAAPASPIQITGEPYKENSLCETYVLRWISTQDSRLREVLNDIPGIPCLFLTYHGLFMETPSEVSRKTAEKERESALGVAEWEMKTDALKGLKEMSNQRTASIFRKRKAKGPNPLSCKKKKTQAGDCPKKEASTKTKRKRRKKRRPQETHASQEQTS